MFTIESEVPVPVSNFARYPWNEMKVGDSILVAAADKDIKKVAANVRSSAYLFARNNKGKKFTVRRVNGGVRAWRLS